MLLALLIFTFLSPSISSASCPEGWMEADGCFKFLPEETGLSWMGAIHACEKTGGYLAEPQILGQMEVLSELAIIEELGHGSLNWWIGALDSGHEGRWTWLNSVEEVPDDFWGEGSPSIAEGNNLDCALMQLIGTRLAWVDVSCESALYKAGAKKPSPTAPLCQHKIQPTTTTATYTTSTTAAETTTPWFTDCTKICEDLEDGFYSDPDHCCESSYCFCINGRGSLAHCEDWEMAWCDIYSSCIPKEECLASSTGCCSSAPPTTAPTTKTTTHITTPTSTTTTTTTTPPLPTSTTPWSTDCTKICEDLEDGFYSDPEHCCESSYCFCLNGRGSLAHCEDWEMAWCDIYSSCIPQEECLASSTGCCPSATPTTTTTTSTTTPKVKVSNPVDCTDLCADHENGVFSDHSCCSDSYCFCIGGQGSRGYCEGNSTFCEYYSACIDGDDCLAALEGCCPYDPPPTPDPHPDDCNTFCHNQDDGDYSESCCSKTYCTCNHGHGSHSQCREDDMAFCDSVKSCIPNRECGNSNEVCCQ